MLNKKVIIRTNRAGVFFGTLKEKNGTEATLTDCRRLGIGMARQVFHSWRLTELAHRIIANSLLQFPKLRC